MLQFSLGGDFSLVTPESTAASRLNVARDAKRAVSSFAVESRAPVEATPAAISSGPCLPGDAMSEFGCITPKVLGPGASAVNQYYVCPPNSTEYSQMWCLRSAPPKGAEITAHQMEYETPPQQQQPPPPVMTMYVCSDGTRVSDPSSCPVIATEVVQTEPEPTDGSGQSPGMQVTPSPPPMPGPDEMTVPVPQWGVEQERKRWMKWATIGAVVLGAGVVAAVLRR